MYYTIYRTTNLITGKIYVGYHQTEDLADGYLGSGKYFKHALDEYGRENFHKEILFVFDNPEDMFAKEAELVDEDFVSREDNYNLQIGGRNPGQSARTRAKAANTGKKRTEQQKKNIAAGRTGKGLGPCPTRGRPGVKKSSDARTKISKAKAAWWGQLSPSERAAVTSTKAACKANTGRIWVSNPETSETRFVDRSIGDELISSGWVRGRANYAR